MRCRTCWRRPTFAPSSTAIVEACARRAASSGDSARTSSRPGSAPVLIDLMERGFVSAIATNGAAVIHDFEVALAGATSEDVDEALGPGSFGMADETGRLLNGAINDGVAAGLGIGQAVGRFLLDAAAAVRGGQRRCGGRAARHSGDGARRDRHRHHPHAPGGVGTGDRRGQPARFPLFRRRTSRGSTHGVYLNCGSAVVLPEVFLKAVALARNRGLALDGPDDGESGLRARLSAADQRRDPADRRQRPGLLARRAPRDDDSAAGRGA